MIKSTIEAQLRRLFLILFALAVVLLLTLTAVLAFSNVRVKTVLAKQISREARRGIVRGDYRDAYFTLNSGFENNFLEVVYYLPNGNALLQVPEANSSVKNPNNWIEADSFLARSVSVPLELTRGEPLGKILYTYNVLEGIGYVIGLWSALCVAAFPLMRRAQRSVVLRHEFELESMKNQSIANTTQALSHDVRKPLAMFKSIVEAVQSSKSSEESQRLMVEALPEVKQSLAAVDGLIQDVMQIGSHSAPLLESVSVEHLVRTALEELFRVYPKASVGLKYDFKHDHFIEADTVKVGRVFANILGNAVQAMNESGDLWIHTQEQASFVEFVLGNAGSIIPAGSISKLFDAFYTSGKKGGTGLGLAIAKKTVELHGGSIYCRSSVTDQNPSGQVEFVFTLPKSKDIESESEPKLPAHSSEIQATFAQFVVGAQHTVSVFQPKQVAENLKSKKLKIAYIEDSLAFVMAAKQKLAEHTELFTFRSSMAFSRLWHCKNLVI